MRFLLPLLLLACSDDIELPGPIAGGGVSAGEGDRLVLHAIDEIDGSPIAGAAVSVGGASVGTTDANGALAIESPGAPPFAISMSATGHRATEWIGVTGMQVTIPLRPEGAATRRMSIGWSGFTLESGTSYSAFVGGTVPREAIALDAGIPALEAFVDVASTDPLDVEVPFESTHVYAFLLERDDAGTPADRSDDTFSIAAFGISAAIDTAAVDAMVVAVPSSSLVGLTVGVGSLPDDLIAADVIGVPGLAITDGQVLLFPPLTTLSGPQPAVVEGAGAYWAVGEATEGDLKSRVVARSLAAGMLTDPTELRSGDFLAPPMTTTLPNGATFWIVDAPGSRTVAFTGTLETMPAGATVRAVAGTIDPASFVWRSATDAVTAVSSRSIP